MVLDRLAGHPARCRLCNLEGSRPGHHGNERGEEGMRASSRRFRSPGGHAAALQDRRGCAPIRGRVAPMVAQADVQMVGTSVGRFRSYRPVTAPGRSRFAEVRADSPGHGAARMTLCSGAARPRAPKTEIGRRARGCSADRPWNVSTAVRQRRARSSVDARFTGPTDQSQDSSGSTKFLAKLTQLRA